LSSDRSGLKSKKGRGGWKGTLSSSITSLAEMVGGEGVRIKGFLVDFPACGVERNENPQRKRRGGGSSCGRGKGTALFLLFDPVKDDLGGKGKHEIPPYMGKEKEEGEERLQFFPAKVANLSEKKKR